MCAINLIRGKITEQLFHRILFRIISGKAFCFQKCVHLMAKLPLLKLSKAYLFCCLRGRWAHFFRFGFFWEVCRHLQNFVPRPSLPTPLQRFPVASPLGMPTSAPVSPQTIRSLVLPPVFFQFYHRFFSFYHRFFPVLPLFFLSFLLDALDSSLA